MMRYVSRLKAKGILLCLLALSTLNGYQVESVSHAYYLLDKNGNVKLTNGKPEEAPIIPQHFRVAIHPAKTAFVVIDPFADIPSPKLQAHFAAVAYARLIPLVQKANQSGHHIAIFSNHPHTVSYCQAIYPELQRLVEQKRATLFYHQTTEKSILNNWIKRHNINTLIHLGFSSNQCVIGRPDGLIAMRNAGIRLFFVPEASAALETQESWESHTIHHATTLTIAQWLAPLLHWDSLMEAMR